MDNLHGTSPTEGKQVENKNQPAKPELPAVLRNINDGIQIREYRPEDRPTVERICELTGLRGELDTLFCDRPLFVRLWLAPYLDGEPEHCLVAVQESKVIGYLVGTAKRGFKWRAFRCLFPHLATLFFKWMTGQYRHHPPSGHFVRWVLFRSWREFPKVPENAGSFHFNLDPELVAVLVGERLIARFDDHIRNAGLDGWYAVLFSSPTKRPVRMYKKMGFEIVDKKPCTLFPEGDVSAVCIYKPITEWMKMIHIPMTGETGLRSEISENGETAETP